MVNWIEMQVVTVNPTGRDRKFAYDIQLPLTVIGNSKWILIPEDVSVVAVQVELEISATAKVQHTLDSLADVKAGVAKGHDWDLGVVTSDSDDSCDPVTAIRLVLVSGSGATIKVRSQ